MEARSREVLVVWISFCLIFKKSMCFSPLVKEYAPAVDPRDLCHLVLADRKAVDALGNACVYLSEQSKDRHGGKLFSNYADDKDCYLEFAERYARDDSGMMDIWTEERDEAERKNNEQWATVLKQQKQARDLRDQIRIKNDEFSEIKKKYLQGKVSGSIYRIYEEIKGLSYQTFQYYNPN